MNSAKRACYLTLISGVNMPNSELEFDAEYFVDDLTDEEIIELVEMNEWEPDFSDDEEF